MITRVFIVMFALFMFLIPTQKAGATEVSTVCLNQDGDVQYTMVWESPRPWSVNGREVPFGQTTVVFNEEVGSNPQNITVPAYKGRISKDKVVTVDWSPCQPTTTTAPPTTVTTIPPTTVPTTVTTVPTTVPTTVTTVPPTTVPTTVTTVPSSTTQPVPPDQWPRTVPTPTTTKITGQMTTLPETGVNTWLLTWVGFVLIVVGVSAWLFTKRHK